VAASQRRFIHCAINPTRPEISLQLNTATLPRRKFHRLVFLAAGVYNIAWGLYSVWDPQWLFRYAHLPLQNHPQIFACLGMVVGLYGIIYFEIARVPDRGWLLAAVGLLGKLLGPIGLRRLIWSGVWPPSTLVLSLTNDLMWWIPFALYLHDSWPFFQREGIRTGPLRQQ
jgi:hypothetical protein